MDNIDFYPDPELGDSYKLEELKNLDVNTQMRIMRHWFLLNYEDPAERTPYESQEGGYQFIFGGPYDAFELLAHHFRSYVSPEAIDNLAGELNQLCPEWTKSKDAED